MYKRSNVPGKVPEPTDINTGEIAINFPDKRVYTKNPSGVVVEVASVYDESDVNITGGNIDPQNIDLKVDNDEYGWANITSPINVFGNGNNSPTWGQFREGIFAYQFDYDKSSEIWSQHRINHDYAIGSPIFLHIHWSPNTNVTGIVRWVFEYTIAKGHGQETGSVFGQTQTVTVDTNITEPSQYKHFITEIPDPGISSSLLEPDSIILCRIYRDGPGGTFSGTVSGFVTGLHYQVARHSTKNRAPNFYGV